MKKDLCVCGIQEDCFYARVLSQDLPNPPVFRFLPLLSPPYPINLAGMFLFLRGVVIQGFG